MAYLLPTEQQGQPTKHKKRLNEKQVELLEKSFTLEKKLEPQRKLQLALNLGLQPKQVAIWYQNKRARWKTQRLELDRKLLESQLESVVAEKRRLEREVGWLRKELERVREGMGKEEDQFEGEGSGSVYSKGNCMFGKEEKKENEVVLSMEEVYDCCLMGFQGEYDKLKCYDLFTLS